MLRRLGENMAPALSSVSPILLLVAVRIRVKVDFTLSNSGYPDLVDFALTGVQ
jgi:hypothetical protein